MRNDIRDSGIDIIGNVPWGTHLCQFYLTKEDLIDIVVPYLKSGLENNELCIWITSEDMSVEEAKESLKKAFPDIDTSMRNEQIEIIPFANWYINDDSFDSHIASGRMVEKLNKSVSSGYNGLRLTENICSMKKESMNEFVNYERRVDSIIGRCPIIALCTCSLETCSATDIMDIVANHQLILAKKGGKWEQIGNSGRKNATECKQAEEALHATEARYQSLYENSLDGILLTRTDGTILSANPQACYLFGMTEEEIKQMGREGLVVKDQGLASALEERELTGRVKAELTFRRKDGSTFVGEISSGLFKDTDGNLNTSMIIRDVTERKKAEEALRKSEEHYRILFTNMTEGFALAEVVFNKDDKLCDYRFLEINPAFELFLGVKKEEILSKTMLEVFPNTSPISIKKYGEVAFSGQPTHFEVFSQVANKYLEIYSFSPEKGKIALIFRDVTKRKQAEEDLRKSEERYRMLFTNMTEAFFIGEIICNRDGTPYDYRHLEMNPAYELILGAKKEQVLGKPVLKILPNVSPITIEKYSEVALSGRSTHFEIFSQLTNKYLDFYVFSPEKGKFAAIITDVTKRKQAEEALRKSEERYRMLFTNMTEGFGLVEVIYNNDGKPYNYRYIEVNPAFELYLGIKREKILGKTMLEVLPDVSPTAIEKYGMVALSGQPTHFEIFSSIANKYIEIYTFSPEKGKLALVLRDITERKEAEAKLQETLDNLENLVKERTAELEKAYQSLKESEKGLAEAQEMAHIGNWDWNLVTGEIHWSNGLYRIFERNPQKLEAPYYEFLNSVHPDDRNYVNNVIEKAINGKPYSIDYRIILANGDERAVHMQSEVIFNEKNAPVRIKGIIQDITERKLAQQKIQESEERYRSFIENFKGIAFQADENFIPVFLHGTVEEITGYKEEEFMSKQPWKEIIHPEDLPNIYKEEERIRNSPYRTSGEIDFRIIRRDGKIKWVHEIYQKITGNKGRPDKYQGAIYDITERKEAEASLARMEKIRIKEIHHRIKNNLQVISSLLDLQSEAFSHLDVCKVPEVIEAFIESQNRVISMALIHEELYKGDKIDTLDFAVYLRRLTADVFGSYNLRNENVSLKLNLDQIYLGMDTAIPLGIIVNELVSNSIKHAFPAGKKGVIQINLCKAEVSASRNGIPDPDKGCMGKNNFHYMLTLADNGKGIPKEIDIENVESLGLQLVNILVEQIDGCMKLERSHGTKFIIWFSDVET
jgi:PAS domain S-box-containing protein